MVLLPAKRGKGIDELLSHLDFTLPEEIKTISITEGAIPQALQTYAAILDHNGDYSYDRDIYGELNEIVHRCPLVLSPTDIQFFFRAAAVLEHREKSDVLGPFTDQLIQNSYDARFNHFTLDLKAFSKPLPSLCCGIRGTSGNQLHVTIVGDVDSGECDIANYAYEATVCFTGDYKSQFSFHGPPGIQTFKSTLIFYGEVSGRVIKHTSPYSFLDSYECDYKTTRRDTLQKLVEGVDTGLGHKIYFIHPTGEEELIREDPT